MRKTVKVLLIFVLFIGIVIGSPKTINASSSIKVLLEGKELSFDVPPQVIEGRTLLPLRAIFEALGLEVGWDNETKTISGTAEGKEIILKLDSKDAKVNGVNKTLDVPAKAINGRTLVPVRFISESLDMNVIWNQENKTVKISKDEEIFFEDKIVEEAVRKEIKKPTGKLYKSDVANITSLSIDYHPINNPIGRVYSLEGIQNLENLNKLNIGSGNGTNIDNLMPIKTLSNLKTLTIIKSNISDIEAVKGLIKLEHITIEQSKIEDISPLKNLYNLREINFSGNKIKDISTITELPKLSFLNIINNNIDHKTFNNILPVIKSKGISGVHDLWGEVTTFKDTSLQGTEISKFEENDLNSIYHLDELFKRLPISEYVKIFDNNGIYFRNDDIFRLNKTEHYEDGSISYNNSYGRNQLIARFDLGKQSSSEFENLKEEFKIKYGRPFTEDVEEDNYRNAKITRWSGIELRRYSDSVRGETTQLWLFIQEESGNNELVGNKELSISEIKGYLTNNYGTLDTNIGTTKFTFKIYENESSNKAYDYWIQVEYDYNYFEGAMNSNKYSSEQKNRLRQELKEHQRKLAEALIELLPNKKLYGGYYNSFYTYPNLKVDLNTIHYYSWTNYDDIGYSINSYEATKPSNFRWHTLIDRDL